MEKLSQLDELMNKGPEDYKYLSLKVEGSMASELSAYAKKLGTSRTKLVKEIFLKGLDWFRVKMGDGKVLVDEIEKENMVSAVSGSTVFDKGK